MVLISTCALWCTLPSPITIDTCNEITLNKLGLHTLVSLFARHWQRSQDRNVSPTSTLPNVIFVNMAGENLYLISIPYYEQV